MSLKQIEIACPCCEATLVVDVLTQTVLKHAPKAQLDATGKPLLDEKRWQSAQETIQQRGRRSSDAFDQALQQEADREKDLDDLFRKAQEKAKKRGRDD